MDIINIWNPKEYFCYSGYTYFKIALIKVENNDTVLSIIGWDLFQHDKKKRDVINNKDDLNNWQLSFRI